MEDLTSHQPWPSIETNPSKVTSKDKAEDLGIYREGDTKVIPPSTSNMESIIQNITDIEKEGNQTKAKNTKIKKITKPPSKVRKRREHPLKNKPKQPPHTEQYVSD